MVGKWGETSRTPALGGHYTEKSNDQYSHLSKRGYPYREKFHPLLRCAEGPNVYLSRQKASGGKSSCSSSVRVSHHAPPSAWALKRPRLRRAGSRARVGLSVDRTQVCHYPGVSIRDLVTPLHWRGPSAPYSTPRGFCHPRRGGAS